MSQAEVVRRALDAYLAARHSPSGAATERALALVGKGASGHPDLAEEHDRHLGAAIAEGLSPTETQR